MEIGLWWEHRDPHVFYDLETREELGTAKTREFGEMVVEAVNAKPEPSPISGHRLSVRGLPETVAKCLCGTQTLERGIEEWWCSCTLRPRGQPCMCADDFTVYIAPPPDCPLRNGPQHRGNRQE